MEQSRLQDREITRDKEGHFIMTKKINLIHQKSITIVDMYASNYRASKYVQQKRTEK